MEARAKKPEFGSPCNNCGICCCTQPCQLAKELLNAVGKCVALEFENGKSSCGLVRRPAWYLFGEDRPESETGHVSAIFADALGIGRGCDAEILD